MVAFTRFRPAETLCSKWFAQSPLRLTADSYVRYLTERGYAAPTVDFYFRSVAHFVYWFDHRRAEIRDINESLMERFVNKYLPVCRCAPKCLHSRGTVRAAVALYLKMLRLDGQCTKPESVMPDGIAVELADFDLHLAEVRGLCPTTRATRLRHLQDFLIDRFDTGPVALSMVTSADIAGFMHRYTAGWKPASIKAPSSSLRSYFLFKAIGGEQTTALTAALPRVAQWRLAGLPQVLSTAEIKQFLGAFDRDAPIGKRDYAIARCLLDLGLRRAEVARLEFKDVDWQAATLRIHAKGRRVDVLPLPANTGRAIAAYLQDGRPQTTRREIFVRHRPPINAPAGLDIGRNAVRYAARRCHLEHRIGGTHILRHTVADRLVQSGTPFKEISDFLRHRSLDTTTIYAKVDLPALARVALPWAGRFA